MSVTKDINSIYRNILDTAWMSANEKGVVNRLIDPSTGEKSPVMIEDNTDNKKKKIAVLPIQQNLVGLDSSEFIVMHPLSENPSKPASPVVDFIRKMLSVRLNWTLSIMLPEMLAFAASPAKHDLLAPEQIGILTVLTEVDKNSAAKFEKLVEASKAKYGHFSVLVSVYLTRSGVVGGKTYHRAAITKFTLYDELVKAGADNVVLGVKLTKKERSLFTKLFERIIPGIDEAEMYNTGSNANVAPFMDAMMNTFLRLFSATNDIVEDYEKIFSIPEHMLAPLKWSDDLLDINNLASLVRLIPPQRGNEGDIRVEDKLRSGHEANMDNFKSTATKDASGNDLYRPQPVAVAPVMVPVAVPVVAPGGTVSFSSMVPAAPVVAFVPPWENAPPVTGFGNNNNQSQSNQGGKISFGSLQAAQQMNNFRNQGQQQKQGRASFFGGNNNNNTGSRSGF